MFLGGKTEGLITLAVGAERQNYIAESHTKNKILKWPKFELRNFSGEEKNRLGFWGLLTRKGNGRNLEKDKIKFFIQATTKGAGLLSWSAAFNV
jgi:hypothetical protein